MLRAALAALLAALALLAAGCSEAGLDAGGQSGTAGEAVGPDGRPVADSGRPGPGFSVPALDGEGEVSPADYRGTPLVLNFWASWCGPCKREMPALVSFADAHPEVAVLGLAVNDRPADSRRFAERYGVGYDLGIDDEAEVAGLYGATGLPVTVYLDRQGRILSTQFGEVTRDDLEAFARRTAR